MAPSEDRIRITVTEGIAEVTLTRGDKHNGLDWPMFQSINAAIDEVRGGSVPGEDEDVRVVVLSGEGPSFCAGLDFKSFASGENEPGDGFASVDGSAANFAQRVAFGWRELEVPVIAAVHGACFGGGFQIALGADLRFAAPGTRMSAMEIRYGLVPDMSLSRTLPRLVRDDVARELTYTGRIVEAEEAAALGLVTRIAEDPVAEAKEIAAQIAAASPSAIRAAKRLLNETPSLNDAEGLALEAELQESLIGTPDQIAAVTAASA